MKNRIVYVPASTLDKELFVRSIQNYKDVEFIGSVESEYMLKRFIKLYNPDTILFYSTRESLPNQLKWCSKINLTKHKSIITFILDKSTKKYEALCLRAGANIILSDDFTLKNVLENLKLSVKCDKIALPLLSRVANIKELEREFKIPAVLFRILMGKLPKTEENRVKKDDILYKFCQKTMKMLNFKYAFEVKEFLKNEGFLPRKGLKYPFKNRKMGNYGRK